MNRNDILVKYEIEKNSPWTYYGLSYGWRWIGSRRVYDRLWEDKFEGDVRTRDKTVYYLYKVFNDLLEEKIIKNFIIN